MVKASGGNMPETSRAPLAGLSQRASDRATMPANARQTQRRVILAPVASARRRSLRPQRAAQLRKSARILKQREPPRRQRGEAMQQHAPTGNGELVLGGLPQQFGFQPAGRNDPDGSGSSASGNAASTAKNSASQ